MHKLYSASLKVECFEDRLAPVVGAFDVPNNITGLFPGVVEFGPGTSSEGCTGTLLPDGRHILTAAHCIPTDSDQPTVPVQGVTVRFDLPDINGGLREILIAIPRDSIFVHPDWNGNVDHGNDVAILRLPVIAPFGNGPLSIAYSLFTDRDEPGQPFVFVGYGATGTGSTGENTIDAQDNDVQRLFISPAAGPFRLKYAGHETTELAPDATADDILQALTALAPLQDFSLQVTQLSSRSDESRVFDLHLNLLPQSELRLPFEVIESGPEGEITIVGFPASDGQSAQITRLTIRPNAGNEVTLSFAGRTVTLSSDSSFTVVDIALRELIEADGTGIRRIEVHPHPFLTGIYDIVYRNVDYSMLTEQRIPELTVLGAGSAAVLVANDVGKIKRLGTNTFLQTAELDGNLDATMSTTSPAGTGLLGSGDSGGPAFLNNRIAGIASYGDGVSGFGNTSSWARVSSFLPFIYEITQLDRIQKDRYEAVWDLSAQLVTATTANRVEVRESDGIVRIILNGELYFMELASNLSGVKVLGVGGATTVLRGFGLTVPLVIERATEEVEPAPVVPPVVPPIVPPVVPPVPTPRPESRMVALGAGAGGGPRVDVYHPDGTLARSFFAYDPTFTGGVRVAVGDVTGDGIPDIVTAAGPGGGPHVKVFDGLTGAELYSFFAFEPTVFGGLSLAVGDFHGDGRMSIVVGAGLGSGPRVDVFEIVNGSLVRTASFFAFETTFYGGVSVAVADGRIVVGAGLGGGPVLATFDPSGEERGRVFAFPPTFSGGVSVAAISGLIAAAPGAGGGTTIQLFQKELTPTQTVTIFGPAPDGGLTVALKPGDQGADLFVGPGAGAAGRVLRYFGPDYRQFDVLPFDGNFSGGVFVG